MNNTDLVQNMAASLKNDPNKFVINLWCNLKHPRPCWFKCADYGSSLILKQMNMPRALYLNNALGSGERGKQLCPEDEQWWTRPLNEMTACVRSSLFYISASINPLTHRPANGNFLVSLHQYCERWTYKDDLLTVSFIQVAVNGNKRGRAMFYFG